MAENALTTCEAFEALQAYFDGEKTRHVCARFKVDPRRLYEVLDGDDHNQARADFLEWLRTTDPTLYEALKRRQKWRRHMAPPAPTPLFG
jgi:hypothetical protein